MLLLEIRRLKGVASVLYGMSVDSIKVTFQAQEWVGELPVIAEQDPNRVTFEVPVEDAIISDSEGVPSDVEDIAEMLPADDSLESDELASHENAPQWVRDWVDESNGPFYVETAFY